MKTRTLRSGSSITIRRADVPLPGFVHCGMHRYSSAHIPIPEHSHTNAIEICYLSSGRQVIDIGDERFTLHGNDVLITKPGVLHGSSEEPAEKCALYYFGFFAKPPLLGFTADDASAIIAALSSAKRIFFPGTARMKTLLDDAFCAFRDKVPFYRGIIMTRFMDLLLEMVSSMPARERKTMPEAVVRAMRFTDDHIGDAIDTPEMARAAGVSVPQMKRLFAAEVGIPPKEFILRRKIDRAKEMLSAKRMPVTDIGLALGFSSSQHFATIFKRYAGVRPIDFRKKTP